MDNDNSMNTAIIAIVAIVAVIIVAYAAVQMFDSRTASDNTPSINVDLGGSSAPANGN